MADKDYKAFIVEGEAREPQVIDNISKVFFKHGNFKIITLPAGENIYMLWKKLKADDFDTDIIEVLRESNKKIREQLGGRCQLKLTCISPQFCRGKIEFMKWRV